MTEFSICWVVWARVFLPRFTKNSYQKKYFCKSKVVSKICLPTSANPWIIPIHFHYLHSWAQYSGTCLILWRSLQKIRSVVSEKVKLGLWEGGRQSRSSKPKHVFHQGNHFFQAPSLKEKRLFAATRLFWSAKSNVKRNKFYQVEFHPRGLYTAVHQTLGTAATLIQHAGKKINRNTWKNYQEHFPLDSSCRLRLMLRICM